MSDRAGERHSEVVDANVRMMLLWVVSELELLRIRRANIVCVLWWVSRACCEGTKREALSFELSGLFSLAALLSAKLNRRG